MGICCTYGTRCRNLAGDDGLCAWHRPINRALPPGKIIVISPPPLPLRRTRVYIAGPMTGSGNAYHNVYDGLATGALLLDRGYAPYIPHLTAMLEMTQGPRSTETWLELDKAFLLTCDALLRRPGVSPGADKEVEWAREAKIEVYYSLDSLCACEKASR